MNEHIIGILLLCSFDDEVNGEAILYAVLSECVAVFQDFASEDQD